MALIKCPECGRNNVSDSAEMCPECGYGIKAHFEKIKQEEIRKEQARKLKEATKEAEIEERKRREERIKSVPQLKYPQLIAPIVTFIISALCFWIGSLLLGVSQRDVERSIAHGDGDPHFYGGLFICIGIGLICLGIYLFHKRIERYILSKTNLEEYQRQVILEQDVADASARIVAAVQAGKEASKPECPYCHSHNTNKITTTAKAVNTAMFGIYGQKRKYQWHCNNCKSNF